MVNHTSLTIQCQEGDRPADPWTDIEPANCSALWPKGLGHHDNTLRLKVKGTNEMTAPFSFTENHTVLLKLHNQVWRVINKNFLLTKSQILQFLILPDFQFGGINVDVQVSEGNIFINLSAYETGLAPALIVNHTGYAVDFWEKVNQPAIKYFKFFPALFLLKKY